MTHIRVLVNTHIRVLSDTHTRVLKNTHIWLNIDGGFTAGQSQYCDIDLTVNRTGISLSGFGIGNWTPGQSGSGTVEI